MVIRPYQASDREAVKRLHASYEGGQWFADPEDPLNAEDVLIAEENGEVVGVGIGRRTIEAFFYVDQKAPSNKRWRIARRLADEGRKRMAGKGYGEYHMMTENPVFAMALCTLPGSFADRRYHVFSNLYMGSVRK